MAKEAPRRQWIFGVLLLLFTVSGATGLIDQVCFSKYFGYIVGSTAYAVSAVLAAFMTGLALGAHFGGRYSSRVERPLVAYGAAELAVAGAIAVSPGAFFLLTPLYVALARIAPNSLTTLSVVRWLLALLVVVVPTTAMGATLPLLSRIIAHGRGQSAEGAGKIRERRLAALYAANTLGGALGALLCAYWILAALGLSTTLRLSAALSGAAGLIAILLGGQERVPEASIERESADRAMVLQPLRRVDTVMLGALALGSGWMVFAAEVVSTHLLVVIIGNSAYAFGLILAVFLACLFAGAAAAPRLWSRLGAASLPASLAAAGAGVVLTVPLWDLLPALFEGSGEIFRTFSAREVVRAVAVAAILCVPVTLMGLTFPLLLQHVARRPGVGRLIGRLTAVNTAGAVVGALVTGYLMLPHLGSQRSLLAIGVVYGLAAVGSGLVIHDLAKGRWLWALAPAALLATVAALPKWNLARLTNGANVYFEARKKPDAILFLREDVHGGVTSVTEEGGVRTLLTNGKFQGNTGWEMNAQRFLAHYPSLFVKHFDRALIIGLGTGTTLGAVAAYPWKGIDLVEISPSIVEAAARFFPHTNGAVLTDPRVQVHPDDGRNFLLVRPAGDYDLIGIELSSIWFAGASNLYSAEFYELARKHLKPDGIFQQWVQLHHIYLRDFATVLHTLRAHFRHTALFYGGGQGVIIGAEQPLTVSMEQLSRLTNPKLRALIPNGRDLQSLL
ncbi:MAG TPA: fused MFS/spermidine synthase, partial [Polyangiaceae bacterium]